MDNELPIARTNAIASAECATKPTILIFGLIAADLVFQIDTMPSLAEKYVADDVALGIGGGGANAAMALQRLGGNARLAGRLGDDVLAQLVLDKLLAEHVNCRWVYRLINARSAVSSILIDAFGERQIVNFRGDVSKPGSPDTNDSWFDSSMLEQCKAVLVDTRWEAGALAILSAAKSRNMLTVVDAEAPTSSEAMMLATHIAFSCQGLRDYAGVDDIEPALHQAARQFKNWVCVTDGENGVYELYEGQIRHVPGYRVDVVDTLGAGDVWHAAFTLQLAKGMTEFDAITYANAAAAIKCTRNGGSDGAPDRQEVETFLALRRK